VTTALTNLVASSLVSAITHTPASGPLGPVTTPPIVSPSLRAAGSGGWWTGVRVRGTVENAARPTTITATYEAVCVLMFLSVHPTLPCTDPISFAESY